MPIGLRGGARPEGRAPSLDNASSTEIDPFMHLRNRQSTPGSQQGFTLAEIIGVIALIAILAAIIAPRVAGVIGRGKVSSTAQGLASVRTATLDYLSQNSTLPVRAGTGATNGASADGRFDADLVTGGFTEKLYSCAIGNQVFDGSQLSDRIHLRSEAVTASNKKVAPTATGGGNFYNLDRDTSTLDMTLGQMVVSAFIPGVALSDAIALNKLVDGDVNSGNKADIAGRCIYSAADKEGKVTVHVYIAHY